MFIYSTQMKSRDLIIAKSAERTSVREHFERISKPGFLFCFSIYKNQHAFIRASIMGLVFLITLMSLITSSNALNLAIKLDLTQNAKTNIITPIMKAGNLNTRNVDQTHVTIGFVENIPDQMTADQIGQSTQNFITQQGGLPIQFEVLNCQNIFGKITAIVPEIDTENALKNLNTALQTHLSTLNIKGFVPQLNALTQPGNYTPHISLQRGAAASNDLNAMNSEIQRLASNRNPAKLFFNITSATYRVM